MKNKSKIVFLILAILLTVAGSNEVKAEDPTIYQDSSMIPDLPEDEHLYGVGQEVPIDMSDKAATEEHDAISVENASNLPSKYDPRDNHMVTSIKDQGMTGLCWDYATIATVESSLIRQGYADSNIDLSELHLAYFIFREKNLTTSFTTFCNMGYGEASSYFLKDIGPVAEQMVPMQDISDSIVLDEQLHYAHIEPAFLEKIGCAGNDIDGIKQLIMTYGGVYASAYWYENQAYYKEVAGDSSYHFPYNVSSTNHGVELVGWDDNYSGNNFTNPTEDGAWLVKNSWGQHGYHTATGSGYYWIPYSEYSLSMGKVFAYVFGNREERVSQVEMADEEVTLYIGQTHQLQTTVAPETARNKKVQYEVIRDGQVGAVEVSEDGVMTAVRDGQATVRVKSVTMPWIYDECVVNVLPDQIEVEVPAKIEGIGKEFQLKPTAIVSNDFSYSSSNENVLTISETGIITTHDYGTSYVSVSNAYTKKSNMQVNVTPYKFAIVPQKSAGQVGESISYSCYLDDRLLDSSNKKYSTNSVDMSYISAEGNEIICGSGMVGNGDAKIDLLKAGEADLTFVYEAFGVKLTDTVHITVSELPKEDDKTQEEQDGQLRNQQNETNELNCPDVDSSQVGNENGTLQEQEGSNGDAQSEETITGFYVKGSYYKMLEEEEVRFECAAGNKKSIVIPKLVIYGGKAYQVVAISPDAFQDSLKLKSVTIEANVDIPAKAFKGCEKLSKVTITGKCRVIGKNAFWGCKRLKTITIHSKVLSQIGKGAFTKCAKGLTITVPKSKKKTYIKMIRKVSGTTKIK